MIILEAHNLRFHLSCWALVKIVSLGVETKKMGPKHREIYPEVCAVVLYLYVVLSFLLCWINHSLGFPLAWVLHPGDAHLYFHRDFPRDKKQCSADGCRVKCGRTVEICLSSLTKALQEEASHHQHHAPAILFSASHCKYYEHFQLP